MRILLENIARTIRGPSWIVATLFRCDAAVVRPVSTHETRRLEQVLRSASGIYHKSHEKWRTVAKSCETRMRVRKTAGQSHDLVRTSVIAILRDGSLFFARYKQDTTLTVKDEEKGQQ